MTTQIRRNVSPEVEQVEPTRGRRLRNWLGRRHHVWSDRLHAEGDDFARVQGWEIRRSTGRLGFGSREYRDPRFDRQRPTE